MGDANQKLLEKMASLDKEIQELRGARQQVEQDERQIIEERQKLEKDAEALETEQKRLANKRGVNFLPSKQSVSNCMLRY